MSDRYEIRGKLGKGGMSAVYRALDSVMGREVAIKRLLPLDETNLNEAAGDVLASEAAALARFQHPNIVTVYAFEEDKDGPYVVMELVDGEDLHQVLQDGALSLEDFEDIATQCLEPLISASELNLMHRDIKPGNIMLTMTPSERFLVKILDFGLAKFSQQPSTQTLDQAGSFLGSIDYIAPEQLELMPLDQRADLYSLGCVLYYALAQRAPFSGGNPAETSMNHLNHAVVPISSLRPDVPEPIANWLMRMISREPDERPGNALDALQQFRLAQEGQLIEPAAPPLTGTVMPGFAPPETATGDVLPPGETPLPPVTDSVKRTVINTSPQVPRPRRTEVAEASRISTKGGTDQKEWLKHPVTFAVGGLVLLAILFSFLFGEKKEETTVEVAVVEGIPIIEEPTAEEEVPPGKTKFEFPQTLRLEGAPAPLAELPVTPAFLQRFATGEGLLQRNLSPAAESGGEIAVWMNLKTRGRHASLFPLTNDPFADAIPISRMLSTQHIAAFKGPTRVVTLMARDALATRNVRLELENGFTVFLVGKINAGTGRQIRIEPSVGGGEFASFKVDFSGNVVGSTRVGAGMNEASIKVPWESPKAGVIAYGSSPADGKHHLVSLSVSAAQPSGTSGEYAATPSSLDRLFIGRNDPNVAPERDQSTWVIELVVYDRLLPLAEMKEIAVLLSDFYFTRP